MPEIVITMHIFRLMRSGRYTKAHEILKAVLENIPEVTEQEVRAAMKKLAAKLLEID